MDTRLTMLRRANFGQSVAFAVGLILLSSGLLHVFVWLAEGGSLSGPVSWRKPILFGLSAGMTILSVGWVAGKLRPRAGDSLLLTAFSLSMLAEVGLITLQTWRGVASHFNRSTPFDATTLSWIEWLIVFATIVIADLTRRSFGKLNVISDMALAIRGGMSLLLLSCLLGFVLVAYGNHQVALGSAPEIYGAAGVMKFPHGVPMHAIQFMPIFAWLLTKLDASERYRLKAVSYALASIATFTMFSLVQTFTGKARFDVALTSGVLLMVAFLLGCMALRIGLLRVCALLMKGRPVRAANDLTSWL